MSPPKQQALLELPRREDLLGVVAYGAPQRPDAVQLNVNENPHPPSAALVADIASRVAAAAAGLNRYPDREAVALRADLAAYLTRVTGVALDPAQVWAANGSNEILLQTLLAFGGPGRSAMGFVPSYSMHEEIARTTSTRWIGIPRAADFTLDPSAVSEAIAQHRPDVVFLTSPNNPTGGATSPEVLDAALTAAVGMVVVDEAYAEFSGRTSAVQLLSEHPRLIVSRTMSKAFALAGARVGYLAASPAVVEALHLVRLPYHLSAVTQAVARAALAHADELLASVADVVAERDRLVEGITALGLRVVPTDANFLLFGQFADPTVVWKSLLDKRVLVRDVSRSSGLSGWLRMNAGLTAENDLFLEALAKVVAEL